MPALSLRRPLRRRALLGGLAALPALGGVLGGTLHAAAPERIVALGGAVTETVHALGRSGELVGIDRTSLFPPDLVRGLPQVGYVRTLAAEGVLSLNPTLILASADAGPPATLEQLERSGVRLVRLPEAVDAEGAARLIRAVGAALDRGVEGEALATALERDLAILSAAQAGHPPGPRVLFVLGIGSGPPMVGGRHTGAEGIIRLAGGRNAIDGFEGYKPLSPEAALVAAPDLILTTEQSLTQLGGPAGLLARPELAGTPAGRAGRVAAFDALYLLGFGPRTGQAARDLAKALTERNG
ncbi:heme/hemin ABC transporter substrate-binding protein [Azospirillum doebereinerae]|uniref:Hemin ABC transporter substrate-binding protein n=1 Tax=Azospirillum doebereinerae TaxID=92933 RepID=A0A433J3I3_9PROT|nr:ABC transporter substrate-binding protein [Azospirillum doebereinerae]RUQ66337.1 hemin ABC transporter substrate-binding protein [Azospirillum doebereinerae]